MARSIHILLGGVPFGRSNVGDEAILAGIVGLIREIRPDASITVSTDDPGTAERLQVETVPLFGFTPPYSRLQMKECLSRADVFIWAGATGLSDYPEIPLSMLEIAHKAGTRTVVWGVGMSTEFNPHIYRILPGKRRFLMNLVTILTLGRFKVVQHIENAAVDRARRKIVEQLNLADLVVLRDPESLAAVHACGDVPQAIVGADPAELLKPIPWQEVTLPREARTILESGTRRIGLCIAAQRKLVHIAELVAFLDRLAAKGYGIVFLPMNHETDAPLMEDIRMQMTDPTQAVVIRGRRDPCEIMSIADRLDLVISSRLHLLILAAIVHVPIIGISRGSKVDNFLAPFGHVSAGSVEACDFEHMQRELDRLIDSRDEFREVSRSVHDMLGIRMERARGRLAKLLSQPV